VLTALVAAAAAAVVLTVVLGGSDHARRIVREAVRLERRVQPKVLRLQPTQKLHKVSAGLIRRVKEQGHDEHRSRTRAAARSSVFVSSSTTPPTAVKSLKASPRAGDFARFDDVWFKGGALDYVAEPYVAQNGGRILETWNWGAALSSDGGRTFTFADPYTDFPKAHGGFCCDQLAYYVPGLDLWIWVLQYVPDKGGNILRLAVARGSAAFDTARSNRTTFTLFDISPTQFGWPADAEFDFNGISSTKSSLFISTNVINGNRYEGLILRLPLAALARGVLPAREMSYYKTLVGGVPRLVQGADTTMYFASHRNASTLTVWSWPDGTLSVSQTDVPHDAYNLHRPFHCRRSAGPSSDDWCEGLRDDAFKNDDSILTGWVAKGRVGFAWNAGQDRQRQLPYPYVMTVELDQGTLRLADETLIWSPRYAYQYPAIAPNARGDLGGVVLRGGGRSFESCTAVIRDAASARSPSGWQAYTLTASNRGFRSYTGDYLGAAPAGAGSNAWAASCMDLRGGANPLKHLRVHWFSFGRARDGPR